MSTASRYWRFVRIDGTGKDKMQEVQLREFFWQQFPEFAHSEEVPNADIQQRLLDLYRGIEAGGDATTSYLAGLCLRCFISSQIKQVCIYLAAQFGSTHGFTSDDLLPCVLNDELNPPISSIAREGQGVVKAPFVSLAVKILQTFDPSRGNLETWTNRLVKHNRELNVFLREHGVYLLSDWAILNDTKPKQLERIFSQFHCLSAVQIQQAVLLLESYHAIYRRDRLLQFQSGFGGPCPLPTVYQLRQIAEGVFTQMQARDSGSSPSFFRNRQPLSPEATLTQLQDVAELLRQYRIHARGGMRNFESLNDPEVNRKAESRQSHDRSHEEDEQTEFLKSYRQEFHAALDRAIKQVLGDRLTKLQRKNPQKSEQFIKALRLFHCQGLAMSKIAHEVGLQAQYQVTRLLDLKPLRADVRRQMLKTLLDSVLAKAKVYAASFRLQTLDQQIEVVLDEEVSQMIDEAEIESHQTRERPLRSLFAQRICRYLNQTYNS